MYEGDYLNGRYHGTGKYTLSDDAYYEGTFSDGQFHGEGRLFVPGT